LTEHRATGILHDDDQGGALSAGILWRLAMFPDGPRFRRTAGFLPTLAMMAAGIALLMNAPAVAQPSQTFGTDRNYCDNGTLSKILSTSKGNLLGSAAGGALGGLLGNQLGKGSGNTLMTIVGVVGGALAGGYVGRSMDPTDQACVGQTLEHTPTSQTVAWQNPDNGSSYWVTPQQSYQGPSGQPCRKYVTQAVVNGQTQQTDDAACREANGAWKPVSYNGQQAAPAPQQPAAVAAPPGAVSTDTIIKVQQRLREQGFYVRDNIDGRWGPKTAAAVGNFQRANGLAPTSQLDVATLTKLGVADAATTQ
jgi:surface antigen